MPLKKWRCEFCQRLTTQGPYVDSDGIGHYACCGSYSCADSDDRLAAIQQAVRNQHVEFVLP